MSLWKLGDGKRTIAEFRSWDQLERILGNIEATDTVPRVYTVGPSDEEHFVQFGFSRDRCFIEFHERHGSPISFLAKDELPTTDTSLTFDYAGTPTEIPGEISISSGALIKLLREYVETGFRPTSIDWIET